MLYTGKRRRGGGITEECMASAQARIECQICPKLCQIAPDQSGECRIRVNLDGTLRAVTWGFPSAVHVDPIEKKPLFHFMPGTKIFSIATAGCNLHCRNCQNWQLSQGNPEAMDTWQMPPTDVVEIAKLRGCPSIAYTYSDPIVYFEYALDTARAAREQGLFNVLVTAGYANVEPARQLLAASDAANVDLKFFDDHLYRDICDASLAPVLRFISLAKEMGVVLELTHLVIPTLNDDDAVFTRMCRWIIRDLGPETPLHLSRFSPRHKLQNLPPTPVSTLTRLRQLARAEGLHHVYVGNVPGSDGEHTICPNDGTLLVTRRGYVVGRNVLDAQGRCPKCQQAPYGHWGGANE